MEDISIKNDIFARVFFWMFLGLFATGLIAYFTYSAGFLESSTAVSIFPIMLIAEVVVVLLFSFLFRKLSPTLVAILYFVYAVINGITLSTIFYVYNVSSILYVFFLSAVLFGIFAFIGGVLKKDITKLGTILIGVLLVAIVISIINMFIGNSMVDTVIDWIVLIAFFGITAWDIQQIKKMGESTNLPQEKMHIYGAMMIYLDFINIFLRLLSIFGKRN